MGDGPLPKTISALLGTLLMRLETPGRYGPLLVAHALGNLAAARYDLAEDELLSGTCGIPGGGPHGTYRGSRASYHARACDVLPDATYNVPPRHV